MSGIWDFFLIRLIQAKPTYTAAFLPVSLLRVVAGLQEANKPKPPAPKKTPLYSTEVPTFEPPGKDKALLIGALCNVIIPSLFVMQNNSLGTIYHLIYSGGYHVPRGFCIMVGRWNKFQNIAGRGRAEKAAWGLEELRWRKKSKSCAAKIVRFPDGEGWLI